MTYGDVFADVYDDWYPPTGEEEDAVDLIWSLAAGRPVLELGVGTGRLACPLAGRGATVWGVDCSASITSHLASKPHGDLVRTVIGDIAELTLPEEAPPFGVVFAAFNTFFLLDSVDAQRACLRRAGEVLAPAGRVVVEVFVPTNPPAEPRGQIDLSRVDSQGVVLKLSRWSEPASAIVGRHVEISTHGVTVRPWEFHPISSERLDEMAAGAGLTLRARYGGWDRSPFGRASRRHVSVYAAGAAGFGS